MAKIAIEVVEGKKGWSWHYKAGRDISISDTRQHPTRARATAAAKAHLRNVVKPVSSEYFLVVTRINDDDSLTLTWGNDA
jgi:hypothetical protein